MMLMQINNLKKSAILIAFLLMLLTLPLYAASKKPLSADLAFKVTYVVKSPTEIIAKWVIAPDYYLYEDRMHFKAEPAVIQTVELPQGQLIEKAEKGRIPVYSGDVAIPIRLSQPTNEITMTVDYQGCSSKGFCYPPMHKEVILNLTAGSAANSAEPPILSSMVTDQNKVQAMLYSQNIFMSFILFLGLGVLLAFTPCVLPMIPILTGIIVGQKKSVTTKKAFLLSLVYVFGTAVTYAIAGMIAAEMGSSLQAYLQQPWIIVVVSLIFVLLACSLFGLYELRLPSSLQNRITHLSNRHEGGAYTSVFAMGILSTLIVSPCVTAPLVGVLIYIGQTGNIWFGATTLFAMGIGMGLPLLLIGASAGKWLPKSGPWMDAVKGAFGLLMLAMAIWLLLRILTPQFAMIFWGLLLFAVAIFFGYYLPRLIGRQKFNRSLSVLASIAGMMMLLGGAGFSNPVSNWMSASSMNATLNDNFMIVQNLADFNKQMTLARAANQPVLLDFYADWCESCIVMDKKVFNSPHVLDRLTKYKLLRVDLSKNTAADEALLKYFDVIAPPTVIFFDAHGHELNTQRIIGEVSQKEFLTRLT